MIHITQFVNERILVIFAFISIRRESNPIPHSGDLAVMSLNKDYEFKL